MTKKNGFAFPGPRFPPMSLQVKTKKLVHVSEADFKHEADFNHVGTPNVIFSEISQLYDQLQNYDIQLRRF